MPDDASTSTQPPITAEQLLTQLRALTPAQQQQPFLFYEIQREELVIAQLNELERPFLRIDQAMQELASMPPQVQTRRMIYSSFSTPSVAAVFGLRRIDPTTMRQQLRNALGSHLDLNLDQDQDVFALTIRYYENAVALFAEYPS